MADDSFATPIASLSSREADGPNKSLNDVASYADLLRQHDNSAPQQDMMMMPPPPPQGMMPPPSMQQQQPLIDPFQQQQQFTPAPQFAPQYAPAGDPPAAVEKKAWWKLWAYDKNFWVTLITIFLVLYVVYPKVASMPRFAMGMPTYVLGLISLAGAVAAGAVNMVT